jgi:hypothetical protein
MNSFAKGPSFRLKSLRVKRLNAGKGAVMEIIQRLEAAVFSHGFLLNTIMQFESLKVSCDRAAGNPARHIRRDSGGRRLQPRAP